jgi:hypothetical protein
MLQVITNHIAIYLYCIYHLLLIMCISIVELTPSHHSSAMSLDPYFILIIIILVILTLTGVIKRYSSTNSSSSSSSSSSSKDSTVVGSKNSSTRTNNGYTYTSLRTPLEREAGGV